MSRYPGLAKILCFYHLIPQYLTFFTAEDAESRRERPISDCVTLRFSAVSAVKETGHQKKC